MEKVDEIPVGETIHRVAGTIRERLDRKEKYFCPIKYLSDGTRIQMVFWVDNGEEGLNNVDFGINVTARGLGGFWHTIYNISKSVEGTLYTSFLEEQILKASRIAEKSINKFDGTLGYKKTQAVTAFGGKKVHMGVEPCCVCAEDTLTTTLCNHSICVPCLLRVDRCPGCQHAPPSVCKRCRNALTYDGFPI